MTPPALADETATFNDIKELLNDLCTPNELEMLEQRWRVANLLHMGFPYRVITAKTGASSATIARMANTLRHGSGRLREQCDSRFAEANEKTPPASC